MYRKPEIKAYCEKHGLVFEDLSNEYVSYVRIFKRHKDSGAYLLYVELTSVRSVCGELFLSCLRNYGTSLTLRKGKGTEFLNHIIECVKLGGYSRVSCVIQGGNTPGRAFFLKNGWKSIPEMDYKNYRSTNRLERWIRTFKYDMHGKCIGDVE